jgi:1-acyl-sn-glycerol-3-phosphate acyltransferase
MIVLKMAVGRSLMWLLGWSIEAEIPSARRFIVVGHPHTSTWDFPLFILMLWSINLPLRWIGKKSLFDSSFGRLFYALGGLPVDRSGGKNMVASVAELFQEHEDLALGIAPAGTRKYSPHWRSGFYHMALEAKVPLVLGSIDFKRRVVCILATVHLTGDVSADMDRIRGVYASVEGRNPERKVPVRLSVELEE